LSFYHIFHKKAISKKLKLNKKLKIFDFLILLAFSKKNLRPGILRRDARLFIPFSVLKNR